MLKARGTRIIANGGQQTALTRWQEHEQAVEAFVKSESQKRREQRTEAENGRVSEAKADSDRKVNGRRRIEVMTTNGRSHTASRILTTAQKMVNSGKLPKEMKNALDAFAFVAARAAGVAVDDSDDSTSRLTAQYDGGPGGGSFGSKTPSDKILDARTELREIGKLIPPELRETFVQIVGEEVGSLLDEPMSLEQIGQRRGYLHKQASASGGTQVYDVIALIAHLAKIRGVLGRANSRGERRFVAGTAKTLTEQGAAQLEDDRVRYFGA